MVLADLKQFICWKILFLVIVDVCQMHIKEISIENRVYNYYFDYLIKAKELETESILIDERDYKDLAIYFTGTSIESVLS